ncbi:cellulose synthase subunit BcsC [bacterium BMS3Bbin14]|nr:cellulose synthase subunit BcsC [bacterium BMS3Abin13]GBE53433.1 cellulose synthase subunit BcsC [bacterium BMS3Bbin14]
MATLFSRETPLRCRDFALLHDFFSQVVEEQLPVAASVFFWPRNGTRSLPESLEISPADLTGQVKALCASSEPGRCQGLLILPVQVEGGEDVAAVVADIDPGLLDKMAPEWLRELQGRVRQRLDLTRLAFVDPETGLYNSRALMHCLEHPCPEESCRAFFLIGVVARVRKASGHLLTMVRVARFLEAMTGGPVFHLGAGVFGLVREGMLRPAARDFAHRLQGRLRREGLSKVHIGIAVRQGEQQKDEVSLLVDECLQALEVAERRGPFSLCEASSLRDRENHPLAPPPPAVLARLRRAWRGLAQFGLVLLRLEGNGDTMPGLHPAVAGFLPAGLVYIPVADTEGYVLLPDASGDGALDWARQAKAGLEREYPSVPVAFGVCHWPCPEQTKTAMAVNCRKALLHGRFFGPGSVTVFDHVSLNVSGDAYFDEGDYRQAVREYQAGVRMNQGDINLMNSLGVALAELNRHRQAVACFKQVLKKEPDNFMALANQGFALRMLGRDEEALDSFQQALQSRGYTGSSAAPELSLQLGRLYCNAGRFTEALQVLETLEDRGAGRQEFSLYRLLGEAYMETGREKKAMRSLQRALHLFPQDAASLSMLGILYLQAGEGDDIALGFCRRAVVLDGQGSEHWQRLGWVLLHFHRPEEALAAAGKSLRLRRNNIPATLLMGKVYTMMNKPYPARKRYERVARTANPASRYFAEARRCLAAPDTAGGTKNG